MISLLQGGAFSNVDIIGERRRPTDDSTRSEMEAPTPDIITALYELDEANQIL